MKDLKYNDNTVILHNKEQGSTQKGMFLYLKKKNSLLHREALLLILKQAALQNEPVGNACMQLCRAVVGMGAVGAVAF